MEEKFYYQLNSGELQRVGAGGSFILIILAGLPATTQLSGMSLVTTDPAPIVTLLPMFTGFIINAPAPI